MKVSTKAALLSALVLPGLGHIFLKQYIRGVVLASLALGAAYYLVSMAIDRATKIVEKILVGEVPLTVAAITELVSLQSVNENLHLLNYVSTGFAVCWVFAVVDSWRAGEQITSLKD